MDHRIHQLQHHPLSLKAPKQRSNGESTARFQDLLKEAEGLTISKHAQKRLIERNIHIEDSKWKQIHQKMTEAKHKGIVDSLVIMDDATLIVNTKNNTVITAMDRNEASSQIFSNINGTILL